MKISKLLSIPRNYSIYWNSITTNNYFPSILIGHDVIDTTSKVESKEVLTRNNNTGEENSTESPEKKIVYRRNYSLDNHGKISIH